MAVKTIFCAAKSGFKLENAKASHQDSQYGRSVPWSDSFVEEIKRGLMACRVMYVSTCSLSGTGTSTDLSSKPLSSHLLSLHKSDVQQPSLSSWTNGPTRRS
jgi:hypothetical protein